MKLKTMHSPSVRALTLFLISFFASAGESLAWRETGHFAICEIAYRNLLPAARERVDAITGGRDFAAQCTWADIVRGSERWQHTYPWHYINLDDGERYFAAGNVEPRGDVLQALLLAEAGLADPASTPEERRVHLRFLGHFAGDVHQPLHVGREADRGGNDVAVTWFGAGELVSIAVVEVDGDDGRCRGEDRRVDVATGVCVEDVARRQPMNLHKVWDLLMIRRFIDKRRLRAESGDSEHLHKAYATAIEGLLDDGEIARAVGGTFWDWAAESLRDRGRVYAVGDGDLGRRYYRRHVDYLNRRVALAGHRLAFTLNRLFAAAEVPEAATLEAKHHRLRDRVVELAGERSPLAGR